MTVTVTATRTVTNPPDTPNRIPPPPDPAGVTTAAGDAGRPGVLIDPGLRWPPVACQGMGDWPFFGPDTERAVSRARRVAHAKAICASCAALRQCRVFALRTGQTSGIWGGLSEEERGHAVPARVPPGRRTTPGVPGSSPAAACHVR
jgi:WhiB family redox-sensing transcriptional regulator